MMFPRLRALACCCVLLPLGLVSCEVFTGTRDTLESFDYIMRFCFEPTPFDAEEVPTEEEKKEYGLLRVKLKFRSLVEDSLALLLFADEWEGWGQIVQKEGTSEQLTCLRKGGSRTPRGIEANLLRHVNISVRDISHSVYDKEAEGLFNFRSNRPTWFFLALSNCLDDCPSSENGFCEGPIQVEYDITATNSDDFLRHFGVDKFGIYTSCALFATMQALLVAFAMASRRELLAQRMYHHTVKLIIWSVWLLFAALWFALAQWLRFGRDGKGLPGLHTASLFLQLFAEVLLIMQLLFVAKGWMIVRHKISTHGRVKITIFVTMVAGAFVALQSWGTHVDRMRNIYVYETPPGIALIVLRFVLFVWFIRCCITTVRTFQMKRRFYLKFSVFFGLWSFIHPVMILISFSVPSYRRFAFIYIYEKASIMVAHVCLLVLYNPWTNCNKSFPFHAQMSAILGVERRKGAHKSAHSRAMVEDQEAIMAAQELIANDGALVAGANGTLIPAGARDLAATLKTIKGSGRNVAKVLLRLGTTADELISALDDWEMLHQVEEDEAFDDVY